MTRGDIITFRTTLEGILQASFNTSIFAIPEVSIEKYA